LQDAPADSVPVPSGVVVVNASGVEVGGISVGRDKPGLVGGRVEVTKSGAAGAGVSSETFTHAPRPRHVSRRDNPDLLHGAIVHGKYESDIPDPIARKLWFGKDQDVIAKIVEERISRANFSIVAAQQVQVMTQVCLVIDPPIDNLLPC
jgi:hypothetical protein